MLPRKSLIVYDFDNTLIDTYTSWAQGMRVLIDRYADDFGVDPDALRTAIHRLEGQHRFGDVGGMVHSLKNQFNIPAEPFHAQRKLVRDACFDLQKDNTGFYTGVIQTLQQLAHAGTTQIIYTNSEFPPFLRRLWIASDKACAQGLIEKPEDVLSYFSGIFTRPSFDCDSNLFWDIPESFIHAAKEKAFLILNKRYKPYPDNLVHFMQAFGIDPQQALMIGDNEKDSGCAYQVSPAPVDFCWYEKGAQLSDDVVSILKGYASPDYTYDYHAVRGKVMAPGRTPVILRESLEELFMHFAFEPAGSSSLRSDVLTAAHILPINHSNPFLMPRPPALSRRFGPASHLCQTPL